MEWVPAVIMILGSIGGWIVAVIISSREIRKTFENAAKLDSAKSKRDLSLRAADEMIQALRGMERAYSEFSEWYGTTVQTVKIDAQDNAVSHDWLNEFEAEVFLRWNKTWRSGAEVAITFETWQIVLSPFKGIHEELANANLRFIMSIQSLRPFIVVLNAETWLRLQQCADSLKETRLDIACYIMDFVKELQNYFHSPLFGGVTIPPRQPTDPKYKVLTLSANCSRNSRPPGSDAVGPDEVPLSTGKNS